MEYLSDEPVFGVMAGILEFFRHCPGCGRRFHIVLVDKSEVGDYDTSSALPTTVLRTGRPITIRPITLSGSRLATMEEGGPMIFDVKEFQYTYRCKHCGHQWTETRLEDADETRLRDQGVGIDEEGELD